MMLLSKNHLQCTVVVVCRMKFSFIVVCMDPPPIIVGMPGDITGATPPYVINDVITYSCAPTYFLVGMDESTCSGAPDYEWSLTGNNLPRCVAGD